MPSRPRIHVRQEPFRRNARLEELLALLEGPLTAAEAELTASLPAAPARPVVLIVACARAGSTLLLQFLAESGAYGYPSNLMARFYAAPALGALVQRLLLDPAYQHRDELDLAPPRPEPYRSELGKTRGALQPSEFYYFWRRWFRETAGRLPTADGAGEAAFDEVRAELHALTTVTAKPFAMKAGLLQRMLPAVAARLPDTFVVFLRRDPLFTAQSLLEARERYYGTQREWYSFKPAEHASLAELPPEEQVAAQVMLAEREIEEGLAGVDPRRVVRLSYEELCAQPAAAWDALAAALATHPGCPDMGASPRTEPFAARNERRLPEPQLAAIAAALARMPA